MSFDKVGQLSSELDELRVHLHESLERESAAVESVEIVKGQVESLREEVERLEVEALERSAVEQEYVQTKLELEVARAVERERYKCQETETKLLCEIAGIKKQLSESSKMNIAQSVCASQGGVLLIGTSVMWDVMLVLSLQQLATVVALHVHHHTLV